MLKKLASLVIIASFFSSFFTGIAGAEGTFDAEKFPYKTMQIQVMPEFDYPEKWAKDQPSLLVGQYGTFVNKSGKDFKGTIEIPVPVKEKDFMVYLVAEFPAENKPEEQRPFKVDAKRGVVTWEPGKAIKKDQSYRFVIEYYSNPFEVKKDNKSFTYEYTNQADIEQLDILFYAPVNAKQLKLEPKATNTTKSEYGEEVNHYQYLNAKKDNNVKYSVSYVKKGNDSTISAINAKQPPNDANHTGGEGKDGQPPNDADHAGVEGGTATDQVLQNAENGSKAATEKKPIVNTAGATIIGLSIIIAGVFVFLGLKGNKRTSPPASQSKSNQKSSKKQQPKNENKVSFTDEKKELRKRLLNGKIDQETYEEEIKKLI